MSCRRLFAAGCVVLCACACARSVEDQARALIVDWVDDEGGQCPRPVLEIGEPEALVGRVGSFSIWTLKCEGGESYGVTVTRLRASVEQLGPAGDPLRTAIEEGIAEGRQLADGVSLTMLGPDVTLASRFYVADWPLDDFPPVMEPR
jgi:hypothetical protein